MLILYLINQFAIWVSYIKPVYSMFEYKKIKNVIYCKVNLPTH